MTPLDSAPSGHAPRYRYEATVKLIIAADGLDAAYRAQQAAVRNLKASATAADSPIVAVNGSMLDLKHRPDLDHSLIHQTPEATDG